jgi:hypothetical protein
MICYDTEDIDVLICDTCKNKTCFECKFKLSGLCPLCDRDELNNLYECDRCNMFDKYMAMYVCDICDKIFCKYCIALKYIPYICENKECLDEFWKINKCKCKNKECSNINKTTFYKSFGADYKKPRKLVE